MSSWIWKSTWLIANWALMVLLVCVAIHDVQRVSPAQFWPWVKIKSEQLTDVKAYNQENCTMWMACAFIFLFNGVIGIFNRELSAVLMAMLLFPGSLFLIQRYHRILRRYIVQPEQNS